MGPGRNEPVPRSALELLLSQPLVDDVFDAGDDLLEREVGGIDNHRIAGGLQRGFGARAVAPVALAQLFQYGFGVLRLPRAVLLIAALSPYLGRSIEKNLDLRVGENRGADVSA